MEKLEALRTKLTRQVTDEATKNYEEIISLREWSQSMQSKFQNLQDQVTRQGK